MLVFAAALFLLPASSTGERLKSERSLPSNDLVRPCKSQATNSRKGKGSKDSSKKRAAAEPEAPPACLEVKAGPLEAQEYLQAFVRDRRWNIGDEEVSEDSWTFVRYLKEEELEQVAKTEDAGGQLNWTNAKGLVTVRTSDAGEGFERIQITARFEARGQSKGAFASASDMWSPPSKGTMEHEMISALEKHFTSER